mmetsp:Transcript_114622/g.286514  ORF Transcript_114622/g.286514 Transcript_114622/m.286514 type:complete len:292 (+) Transcript_114622:104-979(+)
MTLGRGLPRSNHEIRAAVPVLRPKKTIVPLLRPKKIGRMDRRPHEARVVVPRHRHSTEAAPWTCGSVQDWLQPQSDNFRCLHVQRSQAWDDKGVQQSADRMAKAGVFGREECLHEDVDVAKAAGTSPQHFSAELSWKAQRLVSRAVALGLPQSLGQQVRLDAEEICSVLVKMLPDSERFVLKLELMGGNVCSRWHQDTCVGRVIITYNGVGTDFVQHDNVNFFKLNGGEPDPNQIIRDSSQIFRATPGDILFMKGRLYPGAVNGLVHKSPEKRFHPSGAIMTRLCFKVDIP